ncbi:hypothetical protein L484_026105 [Morus notabilis]|uniref:Uncharacterized protein n=1 Tax=Morus notabilis TaxID=981085 RepID=W9RG77_9ROSA|nr:hypothetical protein L484_026105 [Morus notabilis]
MLEDSPNLEHSKLPNSWRPARLLHNLRRYRKVVQYITKHRTFSTISIIHSIPLLLESHFPLFRTSHPLFPADPFSEALFTPPHY